MIMVPSWMQKKSCTRRELESLIGTLQHACKVIPSGRSFLRRAIALLSIAKRQHHHIRLNAEFRSDMAWWHLLASHWNGVGIIIEPHTSQALTITSDASGSWGCGAWFGLKWFQLKWDDQVAPKNIAVKELIPILIAAAIWGKEWKGKQVISQCDNQAVVAVLSSRYSKEKDLMQLLRCLFFLEAFYSCQITATHLPGVLNGYADDLSRNRANVFLQKFPNADPYPSHIPSSLLQWLLSPHLDWTSPSWTQQFSYFVRKD